MTSDDGMGRKPVELYFHIPFCVQKCAYCDFLSAPAEEEVQEAYMTCLLEDFARWERKEDYEVQTVFIGGGTPTVIRPAWIVKLLTECRINVRFSEKPEITLEANPGTVTREALALYRQAGVNRISFGLQSVHERELKLLGRIHSYEDFLASFEMAREVGFTNINVDLMTALPGQTVESCRQTLRQAAELGPEHISVYGLMIEEGTPFYERYREDLNRRERGLAPKLLPTEEAEGAMYEDTARILGQYGYKRYEISNYAREGFNCRHNEGYWTGAEYAGFGLGAASYLEGCRFRKTNKLPAYLKGDFKAREMERLSKEDQMAEFMILGLRRMEGIRISEFERRFEQMFPFGYKEIAEHFAEEGLLQMDKDRIFFTERGIYLSNRVLAEFLP